MQVSGCNGKDKRKPTLGKWSTFLRAELLWTSLHWVYGLWVLEDIYSSYFIGNIIFFYFFLKKNLKTMSNSILTMGNFLLSWTAHPVLQVCKDLIYCSNRFGFAFTLFPSPSENASNLLSSILCLGDWGTGIGLFTDGWDQRVLTALTH